MFASNKNRNSIGKDGGNKDADKLEDIVILYLAAVYGNENSNNKYYDDDNKSVKCFESVKEPTDEKIDNDDESITQKFKRRAGTKISI